MTFQPIYYERGRVPAWVTDLAGKSGVYIVRERGLLRSIIYIGESHSGRLKKTLLRHFQHWKGPTSGPTFKAAEVEIAVVRCPADKAKGLQDALIAEHRPRLNEAGKPGFLRWLLS